MYDVIIAGAGPAGCVAAQECARAGLTTLVVEEHGTIGYPVQCAGLLSVAAFHECHTSRRAVVNTVSGAKVISAQGPALIFDAGTPKAVVVDRGVLDFEMAQAAADAGAEFRMRTAACGLERNTLETRGAHGHQKFAFRLLIAADGPRSTIARLLNMDRAATYLAGIQAEIPYTMDDHLAEIYPDASPDFFGYAIPSGYGRARIGLCTAQGARERFTRFARNFTDKKIHLVTGSVPLGVMPRTYGHRTLFCGDAAGFAKPTSGGGVFTGVRSARHAAAVAVICCEQDRFDDEALSAYEKRWKKEMGAMLGFGYRFFQLRRQLSADAISRLIQAMNDPAVIEAIVQYGDMDRPGVLLKKLVQKPSIIAALGTLVQPGFLSLFTRPGGSKR